MSQSYPLRFRMARRFMSVVLKINQKLRSLEVWLWRSAILMSVNRSARTSKSWLMKLSPNDCLTTLAVYDLLELPVQSRLDISMTVLSQINGHTTTGQCSTTPGSQSNQACHTTKSSKGNLTVKESPGKTLQSKENALVDGRLTQILSSLDTTIN